MKPDQGEECGEVAVGRRARIALIGKHDVTVAVVDGELSAQRDRNGAVQDVEAKPDTATFRPVALGEAEFLR